MKGAFRKKGSPRTQGAISKQTLLNNVYSGANKPTKANNVIVKEKCPWLLILCLFLIAHFL